MATLHPERVGHGRDEREIKLEGFEPVQKPAGTLYTSRWNTIMTVNGGEIQKVRLERTDVCRNLPASTAGPFTG